jgi:hypothetical protein
VGLCGVGRSRSLSRRTSQSSRSRSCGFSCSGDLRGGRHVPRRVARWRASRLDVLGAMPPTKQQRWPNGCNSCSTDRRTITNNNPTSFRAFDDDGFGVVRDLAGARRRPGVRAVIWRGEGKSFSSRRDVASIGTVRGGPLASRLMQRTLGIQQPGSWRARDRRLQGLGDGGSFQRALPAT